MDRTKNKDKAYRSSVEPGVLSLHFLILGLVAFANSVINRRPEFDYPILTLSETIWIFMPMLAVVLYRKSESLTIFQFEALMFLSGLFPAALIILANLLRRIPLITQTNPESYFAAQFLSATAILLIGARSGIITLKSNLEGKSLKNAPDSLLDYWMSIAELNDSKKSNRSKKILSLLASLGPVAYAIGISASRLTDQTTGLLITFSVLQIMLASLLVGCSDSIARLFIALRLQIVDNHVSLRK